MANISFRWGTPLLDDGFTTIPNHFFRSYHTIITKEEWLFICHLASYKYESSTSECRPSLVTIAKEMGYKTDRQIRRLRESLENRSLLHITRRAGQPSIYDFAPLSKKLFEETPVTNDKITPVTNDKILLSPMTNEEKYKKKKQEEPTFSSSKQAKQAEEAIEHAREIRADEYKADILAILDPDRSDEERKDHKAAHRDRIAKAISSFDPDAVNWAVPARAGGGDQLGEAMLDAWIVSKMLDKSALTEKIRNGWRNHLVKLATQDGLNLTIGTAVGSVVRVLAPNGPGTGWVGHTSPYQRKFEEDFLDAALSANKESGIKTPIGGVQHVKTPSSGVQHVKV